MRLAVADPPYLGRARRWYGVDGRGAGGGRLRADEHPDAGAWDDPARHVELIAELVAGYDGWAIAAAKTSLGVYLGACPPDVELLVWHKPNGAPSGSRLVGRWEPVIAYVPPARRGRTTGPSVSDVLTAAHERRGFTGAKPRLWTRWVLDVLGYDAELDTVVDLFPGSGAVAAEAAQGALL